MNIGDGTAKKYDLMGRAMWPKGLVVAAP
jgi:hypothetical protein